MTPERIAARGRRYRAARRYRPACVRTLLVAEAPPSELDRYFYFADATTHDHLFRHVAEAILGSQPTRASKALELERLTDRGLYVIDLSIEPIESGAYLGGHVPSLIQRIRRTRPDRVILIKTTVFDLAYPPLLGAGIPVVAARIPFPSTGNQANFRRTFAQALLLSPSR